MSEAPIPCCNPTAADDDSEEVVFVSEPENNKAGDRTSSNTSSSDNGEKVMTSAPLVDQESQPADTSTTTLKKEDIILFRAHHDETVTKTTAGMDGTVTTEDAETTTGSSVVRFSLSDSVASSTNNNNNFRAGGLPERHSFRMAESSLRARDSAIYGPSAEDMQRDGLGIRTGSAIVVNYISVGYMLLPWAFSKAGIILSTLVLAFVAFQSYVTSMFLLEACARAELVDRRFSIRMIGRASSSSRASFRGGLNSNSGFFSNQVFKEIHQQTFELSELCRIFLGHKLKNFFTLTTSLDLIGITWTFAAVFGSSLADQLPIRGDNNDDNGIISDYQIYILIFAVITVPLSCMSILDQLLLQMVFLAARSVMLLLMIGTLIGAYIGSDAPHFGDQTGPALDVPIGADFRHLITIFQVAFFSTAFQFAAPGIADQCKDKTTIPKKVFRIGVSYVFVSNLLLAILVSLFFGSQGTEPSNNLNWLNYHGNTWQEDTINDIGSGAIIGHDWTDRASWASFISSYIVLFAAIDGLAVFPLVAMSLGEILMGAVYGENASKQDWKIQTLFRLAGSVPQLVGAMFISDLGAISKYAGVFTLLSYTTCPALLHIKSRLIMPRYTFYIPKSSRIKMWVLAWFLVVLSGLLIVGVIVDSIVGFSSE